MTQYRESLVPWDTQPHGEAGLNPEWVAKGLISASYFDKLVTKTAGAVGLGGRSVATGTDASSAGVSSVANTFFCVANLTGTASDGIALGRIRFNGSTNFGAALRFNASTLELNYAGGNSQWSGGVVFGGVVTGRVSYAGSVVASTGHSSVALYRNGAKLGAPNTGSSVDGRAIVQFDKLINLGQNNASGATAQTDAIQGAIEVGAVFGSALSAEDIRSLHLNPWQLFAPRSIRIPISTGTGRIYYVIGPNAGWATPTDAEVRAGKLAGGATPTAAGSEVSPTVTTAPFTLSADATGLLAGTDYRVAYVWSDE